MKTAPDALTCRAPCRQPDTGTAIQKQGKFEKDYTTKAIAKENRVDDLAGTDDDLGTNTGVNIRTHHLPLPLNAFTPRQYRLQEQIVFSF